MTCKCAPIPNPDRMTYLVLVRFRDCLAWAEREVGDTDRATTVDHIRSGNLSNVVTVMECNPVEGICRDVTEEICAEAERAREPDEVESFRQHLIDYQRDHDRDLLKHGVHGW